MQFNAFDDFFYAAGGSNLGEEGNYFEARTHCSYYLPLATCHLPLTAHYLLPPTHYALRTTHYTHY